MRDERLRAPGPFTPRELLDLDLVAGVDGQPAESSAELEEAQLRVALAEVDYARAVADCAMIARERGWGDALVERAVTIADQVCERLVEERQQERAIAQRKGEARLLAVAGARG